MPDFRKHLIGTHLPGGITIAACGDPVTGATWSVRDVTCDGCLESTVYDHMRTSADLTVRIP